MAEDRREQELRAAAKQLAGVQRQHRPDQTAAARSQAGQKAQPQRAAQQATTQTVAAQSQAGQKAQPRRAAQQATAQTLSLIHIYIFACKWCCLRSLDTL